MRAATVSFVLTAATALISCDVSKTGLTADEDWSAVFLDEASVARNDNEDPTVYWMRTQDQQKLHFRHAGIKFWNEHPDDSRRIDWLLVTMAAPPSYAVYPERWAELMLAPQSGGQMLATRRLVVYETQQNDLRRWNEWVRSIRADILTDGVLTPSQRRYFRHAETVSLLTESARDAAQGKRANYEAAFKAARDFLNEYPRSFQESDPEESGYHDRLLFEVVAGLELAAAAVGKNPNAEVTRLIAGRMVPPGGFSLTRLRRYVVQSKDSQYRPIFIRNSAVLAGQSSCEALNVSNLLARAFLRDAVGTVLYADDLEFNHRKKRYLGRKFFYSCNDIAARFHWLSDVKYNPPLYPKNSLSGYFAMTKALSWNGYTLDARAKGEDQRFYSSARGVVWDSPLLASVTDPKDRSDDERGSILFAELWSDRYDLRREWLDRHDRRGLPAYLQQLQEAYFKYGRTDLFTHLLGEYKLYYGMSDAELLSYLEKFKGAPDADVATLYGKAQHVLALASKPFEFSAPTTSGRPFSMSMLRGKIVLVDHWATSCSACMSAMPGIHETYLKYKDKGFEVVSIAYDATSQKNKLDRFEKEFGFKWVTLNGEGRWPQVQKEYGYGGFPQYMLLNRDGTIYAGTAEVALGKGLPALLDQILEKERAR